MKFKLHKILVLALALELLVSSIGVAQVSHLCKLAITGLETKSCDGMSNENHGCCNRDEKDNGNNDDSCCKDQIRYFQNKVSGTVHEMYQSFPVEIVVITLLNPTFTNLVLTTSNQLFDTAWHPPAKSGKQKILSINSLLI